MSSLLMQSLAKTGKQDQVIASLFWNQVIKFFQEKKSIDIAPYLVSVKFKGQNIMLKTTHSVLNVEIQNYKSEILEAFHTHIKTIGFQRTFNDIKSK